MSTPGGNSSWLRHVSTTRGNKLIWFNAVTGEYVEDTGQDRDALPKLKLPSASTRIDVGSMLNISRATLAPKMSIQTTHQSIKNALIRPNIAGGPESTSADDAKELTRVRDCVLHLHQ
jgi:hypothetical protein